MDKEILFANLFLKALPKHEREAVCNELEPARISRGHILSKSAEGADVYFPESGVIMLSISDAVERTIVVGLIGKEGIACKAFEPIHKSRDVQLVAASATNGHTMPRKNFEKMLLKHPCFRSLFLQHTMFLLRQAQFTAVCNAVSLSEARLASLLLQFSDRLSDQRLSLSQKNLSDMLGLRRTTVTDAANKLQALNMIIYSRGSIKIVDRTALRQIAFACYDAVSLEQFRYRLIG